MGMPLGWITLNLMHLFWLYRAGSGDLSKIPAVICGDDCLALMSAK